MTTKNVMFRELKSILSIIMELSYMFGYESTQGVFGRPGGGQVAKFYIVLLRENKGKSASF